MKLHVEKFLTLTAMIATAQLGAVACVGTTDDSENIVDDDVDSDAGADDDDPSGEGSSDDDADDDDKIDAGTDDDVSDDDGDDDDGDDDEDPADEGIDAGTDPGDETSEEDTDAGTDPGEEGTDPGDETWEGTDSGVDPGEEGTDPGEEGTDPGDEWNSLTDVIAGACEVDAACEWEESADTCTEEWSGDAADLAAEGCDIAPLEAYMACTATLDSCDIDACAEEEAAEVAAWQECFDTGPGEEGTDPGDEWGSDLAETIADACDVDAACEWEDSADACAEGWSSDAEALQVAGCDVTPLHAYMACTASLDACDLDTCAEEELAETAAWRACFD